MINTPLYKTPDGEKLMIDFYNRMLKNWYVEYSEIDLSIPMGTTHVIAAGDTTSSPLVLLHGSTSNSTTWAGDIAEYAKKFRVYAVDMPGEPGKSFPARLSWSDNEYCDWISQVLNALDLQKVSLVGLSLGGWAALKFSAVYPDRVNKVALIAPGGIVNPNMGAILKMIKYSSQGEKGIDKTLKLLFPDDFKSDEVREFFTLLNNHFTIRTEGVKPIPDDTLSNIKSPVFMVCAANDCFFNFKKAQKRLKKLIPHSETILFEKGSHGLINMAEAIIPKITP